MSHYDAHGTPINFEGDVSDPTGEFFGQHHLPIFETIRSVDIDAIPPSATHAMILTEETILVSLCPRVMASTGVGFKLPIGSVMWLLGRSSIKQFRYRSAVGRPGGIIMLQYYTGSFGAVPPLIINGSRWP